MFNGIEELKRQKREKRRERVTRQLFLKNQEFKEIINWATHMREGLTCEGIKL